MDRRIPAHDSFDVIVAGYGFAGGAAAIAAHDAGSRVLLLEKMSIPGGISICSGGGLRVATDADRAFEYLRATNDGTTPDDLLRAFAIEMTQLEERLRALAAIDGARLAVLERPANYPFPGWDVFRFIEVESVPGFDPRAEYPHARSLRAGINAFKVVDDNVKARGIEVRYSCEARRLLRGPDGEVRGLECLVEGAPLRILAKRGVILACGGFESGADLQRQYWQFHPVLPAATRGNTGDGIRMAQEAGADLRHMWHFHGSYGFRHTDPQYIFGIRSKKLPDWTPGVLGANVAMSWILVDQDGRRFMNEYEPYGHDTGHRPFDRYDPTRMRFPAMPAFMVFDEEGRRMYPVARSFVNDPHVEPYEWSEDNLKEVELGILERADSIEELARRMGVPEANLRETLDRWNALCASGEPDEHGRPRDTRRPVVKAPFYFGEMWPVVSNTQGGIAHDVAQRVLNPFGEPIPRLYVAGELGSIWGFLYLSGGNLAECFVSGRIAGENAAAHSALHHPAAAMA
ncbi:MAG TPA: FAD-dependent oxidoreductase [Usitatibacter sp.]|nr:FAD-dependent oxidoreductase [Usitatibacter sp.]